MPPRPDTRLGPELAELNTLTAAHGAEAMSGALERAIAFSRWRSADVRSILAAGAGTPTPRPAGEVLVLDLPVAAGRPLAEYTPTPPVATKATEPAANTRDPRPRECSHQQPVLPLRLITDTEAVGS